MKSGHCIIMIGVNHIVPYLGEFVKLSGILITFQKKYMVRVYLPDRITQSFVIRKKFFTCWISRFVHHIITGYPGIVFIALSNYFPKMQGPVLEILVYPEPCYMRGIIAMPVLVLRSRKCMQINDGINMMPRT